MKPGSRKLWTLAMGLGALLGLALLVLGGLPVDALQELVWPVALLTGTALGANVGEHWARNRPGAAAAKAEP